MAAISSGFWLLSVAIGLSYAGWRSARGTWIARICMSATSIQFFAETLASTKVESKFAFVDMACIFDLFLFIRRWTRNFYGPGLVLASTICWECESAVSWVN
jgi:hypothetical protein